MTLISGVAGLEHLERPDYLSQVERLNTNRRQLASAPRQLLTQHRQRGPHHRVRRAARHRVALAAAGAARRRAAAGRRPDRQADHPPGRRRHGPRPAAGRACCSACRTDAGAAGEIRAYGLAADARRPGTRELIAGDRPAQPPRGDAGLRRAGRSAGRSTRSALMGAIAFVVVRASEHAISLGTVLMAVSLIRRSRVQLASAAATLGRAGRRPWPPPTGCSGSRTTPPPRPPAPASQPAPERRCARASSCATSRFAYPGTERPVLDDFSVRLPAGSTVALVGENGSGKTTLIKLLLGMYRPTPGTITVDGRPLADIDPAPGARAAPPRSRTSPASTCARSSRSAWPTCRPSTTSRPRSPR